MVVCGVEIVDYFYCYVGEVGVMLERFMFVYV